MPEFVCILSQTCEALKNGPCQKQSREILQALFTALEGYGLTKAERQQIANLRPATLVEMHLIIEDCEERYDEEQLEALLAYVEEHLGPVEEEGGEEQEEQEEQEIEEGV
ncbi:hypothetical protein CYMTET_3831 [Cymbomonas tetramitiformis]|uniref:DNA-directed RNA polymerase III subunit RPC9 n=1 Tax=Cymbomonas tetramitiformis TaxID=36881 RepID=A0AAE0H2P2_9CHLO|nr:hypothetical protein CYMTET_3831 [Cymbomonas tetramitiformis]|eukprot:gene11221-13262_t